MKKVYTTGEVAKLLGININTVIKWFDEGKITGFRLPGSLERRITRTALLDFMRTNSIPLDLVNEPVLGPDRRGTKRYPSEIPVSFALHDKIREANLTNISETGALLTIPANLVNDMYMGQFNMKLDFATTPFGKISATAQIANVRPLNDCVGLGLRFDPPSQVIQNIVRENFA